ncbi:hypothetical protein BOTBODRAFT_77924, partial [Botryobasidium botryosum FD-172 SS1]
HALLPEELQVLSDIRDFLQVPHTTQELLSAERTPTLALAMPVYESLITMLQNLAEVHQELLPAIKASISK